MKIAVIGPVAKDIIDRMGVVTQKTGGTTYYTSYALHKIGIDTSVYAKLSKEDAEILRLFECMVVPLWSARTTIYKNSYPREDPNYREQEAHSVIEPFSIEDVSNVSGFDIVHLGPLNNSDLPLDVVENIRINNGMVSLDAQGYLRDVVGQSVIPRKWDEATDFLRLIDILKCDVNEARMIVGDGFVNANAEKLLGMGPKEIIITNGNQGSYVASDKQFVKIEAVKAEGDTTGAGDTYMAGYLAKRLETNDIEKCGMYGAEIASRRISGKL